ncbi:MAG: APC family permease [Elusimicrobia bacterium]|nr:APC family permease [Elusimicrobiota bacterium]
MTEVVVLTTAMLTFISFWRAGAIVLNDMASTAWYIGGIAEKAIGPSAPWFVLAVMAFSACMLAVYVEASSMFVRGGVYTVVRNAMGATLAKAAVSALIFDYALTGPISSVAAGQYLAGLLNQSFPILRIGWQVQPNTFSVFFALMVTAYFWRQNIEGIEESSEKALRIIQLASVMGLLLFGWSAYTLYARGFEWPPLSIDFGREALGWLEDLDWVRSATCAALLVGVGHSFLGMSGLESLAQVYREMEAPKLKNLKRAALFVFLFAFLLTGLSTLLAALIVPDAVRAQYLDNLLSGLAMSQAGPPRALLALQAFVVVVGVLILSGAVNTSIIGANGILNRLAEDGILTDWFRWLHPRFGTTHRMINLIVALQALTIVLCRGDVYLLGEAYAFGVIWSFVFMTAALVVLRFKDRSPREWMVPLNVDVGSLHFPVGILAVFVVLVAVAVANLFTKKVATVSGVAFTAVFYLVFRASERLNERHRRARDEHREKLNLRFSDELQQVLGEVERPNRILVAIRDPKHMYPLEQTLHELGEDTDVIAFHSKRARGLGLSGEVRTLGPDEELLFTHVIQVAEKAGKTVVPMMVVSNDPAYAIAQAAQALGAAEVVMGASRAGAEAQIERLAMTWGALASGGGPPPIRVTLYRQGGPRMEVTI